MAYGNQRQSSHRNRWHDILSPEEFEAQKGYFEAMAQKVVYSGSPYHKRNPGDFGYEPKPRKDKTLCDEVEIFKRDEAKVLLQQGIQRGLVSRSTINTTMMDWPSYVWAVTEQGRPLEAKYDRRGYHGYPLNEPDPMYQVVLERWKSYDQE